MRTLLLTSALLSVLQSIAQKEEKIVINNRRFNISVEAGAVGTAFKLEGDSKIYNLYNTYGGNFDDPDLKDPAGISVGSNFEYHLVKNSTFASFNVGLHYIVRGEPVFISKGDLSNNFVKSSSDDRGNLRMQSVRAPVYLHVRLFKLFGDEGVAVEVGTNFDYLVSANLTPGKIDNSDFGETDNPQVKGKANYTDVFKRFNYNAFAGCRFQFNRLYLNVRFDILPAKKIFNDENANYNSSNARFEESFTSIGLGFLF